MTLAELSVTQLRCIERAQLEIPPGLALIYGGNGSGKTSLLEAIFLLGRGRSFRTRNSERLIQRGQDHLRVIGRVSGSSGQTQSLGFEVTRDSTSARIGGRPAQSLAELSHAFPVQVIEPGVHKLVEEGEYRRRRWMDWAVFHVEPHFVDTWVRYTRTLKQRNAALKLHSEASVWEPELARLREVIAEFRGRFLTELQPYWQETVAALSGLDVELHYLRGWARDHALVEALTACRERDEARGLTHAGPHRADVAVRLRGRPAPEGLFRGPPKTVAAGLS